MADNIAGIMGDTFSAAMIGLNLLPVFVVALVIGGFQFRSSGLWLKAPFASALGLFIAAALPLLSGVQPIWPDILQMETQIQAGLALILSIFVIGVLGFLKSTAGMIRPQRVRGRRLELREDDAHAFPPQMVEALD